LAGIVEKNLQGWQEVIEQDATLRQQRAKHWCSPLMG
jgi:ferrochelatase